MFQTGIDVDKLEVYVDVEGSPLREKRIRQKIGSIL